MKRIKITSVLLSVAMLCSLLMPSIQVLADEADAPSETQVTDSSDKKEPEETKKPETKDTSKSKETEVPKETKAVKETEAVKETVTPKETEAAKETELPKESAKPADEDPRLTAPKEADLPKETDASKETETAKETEVPKETVCPIETGEPKVTDRPVTEQPNETEQPKETEVAETPAESTPAGSVSKKPKDSQEVLNASISRGILSWNAIDGVYQYTIVISGCLDWWVGPTTTSFDLNNGINELIRNRLIEKNSTYAIELTAYDNNFENVIAKWTTNYTYEPTVIVDAKISNDGILSWTASKDISFYELWVSDERVNSWSDLSDDSFSVNLKTEIDNAIRKGLIEKNSPYIIGLCAYDNSFTRVDSWYESFAYNSSVVTSVKNIDANISDGILTWTAVDGAVYKVLIAGKECASWSESVSDKPAFDLKYLIDKVKKSGFEFDYNPYAIELIAYDSEGDRIGVWNGSFTYNSSAEPIFKATISEDGILTWTIAEGEGDFYYQLFIDSPFWRTWTKEDNEPNTIDLKSEIDKAITEGVVNKLSTYNIQIRVFDSNYGEISYWSQPFSYESTIDPDTILIPKISKGILSWNSVKGASRYFVKISGYTVLQIAAPETTFNLNNWIIFLIRDKKIEKSANYAIELTAEYITSDNVSVEISKWNGTYTYTEYVNFDVNISYDGVLTLVQYGGASYFDIWINGVWRRVVWRDDTSTSASVTYNLNDDIDLMIRYGKVVKTGSYQIEICAHDSAGYSLASWYGSYLYNSDAEPMSIKDAKISAFGILTWTAYEGTTYKLHVSGKELSYWNDRVSEKPSFNLKSIISEAVKSGEIEESSVYSIQLSISDADPSIIVPWTGSYSLPTGKDPITNVRFNGGIMTWDAYKDVEDYNVEISSDIDSVICSVSGTSFEIDQFIIDCNKSNDLHETDYYSITISVYENEDDILAEWTGSYDYRSSISVSKLNLNISSDGILTWNHLNGIHAYQLYISCVSVGYWNPDYVTSLSCDLNAEIDKIIRSGEIEKTGVYYLVFCARDSQDKSLNWSETYYYDSPAVSEIDCIDAKITEEGILTWTAVELASKYTVYIDQLWGNDWNKTDGKPASFDLKSIIDEKIKWGSVDCNRDTFNLELVAFDSNGERLASWKGTLTYKSTAKYIINATISEEGILTWTIAEGEDPFYYQLFVGSPLLRSWTKEDNVQNSIDLKSEIDKAIIEGVVNKNSTYNIQLRLADSNHHEISYWSQQFSYESSAIPKPIISGSISADGILTWSIAEGAGVRGFRYMVSGGSFHSWEMNDNNMPTAIDLKPEIDMLIMSGAIVNNVSNNYRVVLIASGPDGADMASWEGTISYVSTAKPINFEVTISDEGIMTFTADDENIHNYGLWISGMCRRYWDDSTGKTFTVDLKSEIDSMIKYGWIENTGSYNIEVYACDSDYQQIASKRRSIAYYSSANLVVIDNANISTDGILTWTAYEDVTYILRISDVKVDYWNQKVSEKPSFDLKTEIVKAIKAGKIVKDSNYKIELEIQDSNPSVIKRWNNWNNSFTFSPLNISGATVTGISDKTFSGDAITQSVLVNVSGINLENDTDYDISYGNNVNQGTATVYISGKGNFTGTIKKSFNIKPADISGVTVTGVEDKSYTSIAITQSPTISFNGKNLVAGADYTLSYKDNISSGTAVMVISGKGNFTGELSKTFKINKIDLCNAHVTGLEDKSYTGNEVTVSLVVSINGNKLTEGTDYTLSYDNNVELGIAKVTLIGIGSCTGSFTGTFNIVQAPNTLSVSTNKTTKIKIKKLRKKSQVVSLAKLANVSNSQGAVTYKILSVKKSKSKKSFKKYFKVNAKSGNISVKKKLKKGTYTIKCSVTAAGNENYKGVTRNITIKIKVK